MLRAHFFVLVDDFDDGWRAVSGNELHRQRDAVVGVEHVPVESENVIDITVERNGIRFSLERWKRIAVSLICGDAVTETRRECLVTHKGVYAGHVGRRLTKDRYLGDRFFPISPTDC